MPTKNGSVAILTTREQQVANHIVAGLTNQEIAERLGIAYETVKEHVAHILAKYEVPRRELVAMEILREQLTAEVLGPAFMKEFDRRASELERLAQDLLTQANSLRAMVAAAVQKSIKRRAR